MRIPPVFLPVFLAASLIARTAAAQDAKPDGKELFTANCSACHKEDGAGIPNMAPALKDNAIVSGDPAVLVQILLKGPAAVLPANRPQFPGSTMDPYYYKLNDEETAAVLNYVRHTFGKDVKSADVTTKQVAEARAKVDAENAGH